MRRARCLRRDRCACDSKPLARSPRFAPAGCSIRKRAASSTNQVILVEGHADPRRRTERRDSGRRAGDRSVADDRAAGARRGAQPSRAHLQAGAREQHLLLHLRAGIDGAARHSGGVERHPDARLRLHHRPRHGQQRATMPTRRCGRRSSRAGFPGRRSSTPESSSAAWAGSSSRRPRWRRSTTSSTRSISTPTRRDEIVKAVRQNVLFGAKVIKICVDCKPYGYTADEIRLFIREAAKVGHEGRRPRADGERRAERDRSRHLVDRAFDAAERRDAQADGAEGHLARRHRHARRARRPPGVAAGATSGPSRA